MARGVKSVIKSFFSLLAFLTSIPIPHKLLSNSATFDHVHLLPIVGFVRGLITTVPLAMLALAEVKASLLTTFATIALHYIAQGFIHVDGLIDFSEAILAHRFGVDGYKVVKDRYRGSYAIAVFGVYIVGLFSSLKTLVDTIELLDLACLVLLIEIWSTNVMLVLSYIGRKPPEGLGRRFGESVKTCDIVFSLLWTAILTSISLFVSGLSLWCILPIALSALIIALVSRALAHKVLGFVNGDVLGFSSELFYLVSLIAFWGFRWI